MSTPRLPPAFAWLIGGLVCLHACMSSARVASSLWVLRQGHAEWVLGVVIGLYALAPMGLALWAGRMADRHGLQRPMRWATGMGVLGAGLAAAFDHLGAIAAASLLTGGALSVAAVAIQREAGQLAHQGHDLKRVFSWTALGPALSNVIAPGVTGWVIDHVGLRWAFMWAMVLPLLAWWMVSHVGRRLDAAAPRAPRSTESVWTLWRSVEFRVLMVVNLSMAAAWDAHTFAVPVVGHLRQYSASDIGLLLSVFALSTLSVRLGIARWGGLLKEQHMLQAAMAVAAFSLATYAWLPGWWGLAAGSACLGLALGSVQPMVLSALHGVTPADRHGQALGLRMMVTNGATLAMPLVYGLLSAQWGLALPLSLMALALGGAWLLCRAGWRPAA